LEKERKKEQKRKKAGRLVETAAAVEIRWNNTRILTAAWIRRAKTVPALSTVTTSSAAGNKTGNWESETKTANLKNLAYTKSRTPPQILELNAQFRK
jgi:hypothetical protein